MPNYTVTLLRHETLKHIHYLSLRRFKSIAHPLHKKFATIPKVTTAGG